MSAKRLIFNILLLLLPVCAHATSPSRFGLRQHADYQGWQRLTPTHIKLQYAGSMGVATLGVGWDYGRQNQWESDVMVGYLPERYSDAAHLTLSLRQTFTPTHIALGGRTSYEPLSCGIYLNTITGDEYWTREPAKYGGRYYKFTSRVRIHLFVGQRINLCSAREGWLQGASLYYELSACDLNLISKFTNAELKLSDIVFFSAGLRLQLIRPR